MAKHIHDDEVTRMVERIERALRTGRRCCPNCVNWVEKMEECEVAMKRPPADIIAFGCEAFNESIPF